MRAYAPSAKGPFFGDLGEGQLTGERSEPLFTGAAGEIFCDFHKVEVPNFTSKSGTTVVYG